MEPVTESFPQLFRRCMAEQGKTSVMDMWRMLPETPDRTSYETIRLLSTGKQRTVSQQRVIDDLVIILRVSENTIRTSLAMPPTYGDWDLPPRAQSLDPHERGVVIGVVDALLRARGMETEDAKKMIGAVDEATTDTGSTAGTGESGNEGVNLKHPERQPGTTFAQGRQSARTSRGDRQQDVQGADVDDSAERPKL